MSAAGPPRVVFFGPAGAGKTRLIEGVLRAAGVGPDAAALTRADLRRAVEARKAVVDVGDGPTPVELCDTDGEAAGELLAKPSQLGHARPAPVPRAVRRADALVLAVAADASADSLDHTFAAFRRFLGELEVRREHGFEVGGLPVLLTLTKCDALARPGDAPADWLRRVQDRADAVRRRFEAGEADDGARHYPFGSIELETAATAARLPDGPAFNPLADAAGALGVAELARDAVAAALAYRGRHERSERRLRRTVAGVGGLAALLGAALAALAFVPLGPDPLLASVETLRAREGPPEVRLGERSWPGLRRELARIREHPRFAQLPDAAREYVEDRSAEVEAYQQFRAKLLPPALAPSDCRTDDELRGVEAALAAELAPPPEYAASWAKTPAMLARAKWAADAPLLRSAEAALLDWHGGRVRRANGLMLAESPPDAEWRRRAAEATADAPSPVPDGPLPGSPTAPFPRGAALEGRVAKEFDRVVIARADWEATRDRLLALRDLCDALGVTRPADGPPPLLEFPEPSADVDSLPLAGDRLRKLAAAFPGRPLKHPEWRSSEFPDPARRWLVPRLAAASDVASRHVRRLLAKRLPADTPDGWRALADKAASEDGLRDWGALLALLRRWETEDDAAPDPLGELLAFARADRFPVNLAEVEVGWPDDLAGERLTPAGPLKLTQAGREWSLAPRGDARRERPLSFWTFVAASPVAFEVRPGESFRAELPLRGGGQDYRLVWDTPRAAAFAFDAFARAPALERVGPIAVRERVNGVTVEPRPAGGWPKAPALLPAANGE